MIRVGESIPVSEAKKMGAILSSMSTKAAPRAAAYLSVASRCASSPVYLPLHIVEERTYGVMLMGTDEDCACFTRVLLACDETDNEANEYNRKNCNVPFP